jgi:hypothetical protein
MQGLLKGENIMSRLKFQHFCISIFCLLTCFVSTKAQTCVAAKYLDFDGDGKADHTVYRPSSGEWFILQSSNGTPRIETFGVATDKLAPGDYDCDGKTDIAIFRITDNTWWVKKSSNGQVITTQFGINGDLPVAGDFDGDKKTDYAVFRQQLQESTWNILRSSDGGYTTTTWGIPGDIPVRGDFDGDGKADIAVWRPSNGQWIYIRSAVIEKIDTVDARS